MPRIRCESGSCGNNPEDALYNLARAMNGSPKPLAVVKKRVQDLLLSVELNDSLAMIPDRMLSYFDEVIVVARVSRPGQSKEQGGDVFGQADTVRLKYDRNVSITIAEIVPRRSRRFALPVNERILRYTVACFREKVLTS